MTTAFSQLGGLRTGRGMFNAFNASWPLARLQVEDSVLTLRCLGRTWMLPRHGIRLLSRHRGCVSVGLRIDHTLSDVPEPLLFWTFGFRRLKRELTCRGYVVSDAVVRDGE